MIQLEILNHFRFFSGLDYLGIKELKKNDPRTYKFILENWFIERSIHSRDSNSFNYIQYF